MCFMYSTAENMVMILYEFTPIMHNYLIVTYMTYPFSFRAIILLGQKTKPKQRDCIAI